MSEVRIERVEYAVHPEDATVYVEARTVLSGFPPEAVEAAAKAMFAWDDAYTETWDEVSEGVRTWYRGIAQPGLAAAWETLTQ